VAFAALSIAAPVPNSPGLCRGPYRIIRRGSACQAREIAMEWCRKDAARLRWLGLSNCGEWELDRRTGDAMGRKVFQDFAHVLCQKFVEVPSNRDLVNLALLGDGVLRLDITGRRATHNGFPIEPLPFTEQSLLWIESRLHELAIPRAETSRCEFNDRERSKTASQVGTSLPVRRPCSHLFSVRASGRSRVCVDSDCREVMGPLERLGPSSPVARSNPRPEADRKRIMKGSGRRT
jgi:hypothetical protein